MSRDAILSRLRASLGATRDDPQRVETVAARTRAGPENHVIPARAAALEQPERISLFLELAAVNGATVARVERKSDVPDAVARYLAGANLPAEARLAPDPWLIGLPWDRRPVLRTSAGPARATDPAAVTTCFAGIAETGTLMLLSGPEGPTGLNFLPESHIIVLRPGQVVGAFEEAIKRLRARGSDFMPRTINFITGPSRTADIEQTMYMGAHGPKRLHIVLVDEEDGQPPT